MPKFQFKTAKLTILIKQIISRPAGVTFFLINLQKLISIEQIISRPTALTIVLINKNSKFVEKRNPKNHLNLNITVASPYNRLTI
jgi:hypothetical protein